MDIAAAGAIVFDDDRRLLVVRRGRPPQAGRWTIPGGKCEPGESAEAACVRECAEETGLLVQISRPAGRVYRSAGGADRFVIEDFLCRVVGGALRPGDDASEAAWVTAEELAGLQLVSELAATLAGWGLLPS